MLSLDPLQWSVEVREKWRHALHEGECRDGLRDRAIHTKRLAGKCLHVSLVRNNTVPPQTVATLSFISLDFSRIRGFDWLLHTDHHQKHSNRNHFRPNF